MLPSNKIKSIVVKQKLAGKSANKILELAKSAHIQPNVIMPIISEFFPGFKTNNLHKYKIGIILKILDTSNQIITKKSFRIKNSEIQKKYEFYKKHPKNLNRKWWLLFILGIAGTSALFVWLYLDPKSFWNFMISHGDDDHGGWGAFIIPWLPLLAFITYIKKLQKDLIKKIIAEKHHWIYNPEESRYHWEQLQQSFPKIFNRGNKKQYLEDEFWGKFETQIQKRDFYSGIFHYEVVTGSGKHKKTMRFNQTIFAIKLNKILNSTLMLTPVKKGILGFIINFFKRRTILTESIDFNKEFYIEIDGKNTNDKIISIIRKLSPAVQENLLQLAEQFPNCTIYFAKDVFFFLRSGFLFSDSKKPNKIKMKTNFFKKVDIHPDDEKFLEEKISTLLEIANEIPQYLD